MKVQAVQELGVLHFFMDLKRPAFGSYIIHWNRLPYLTRPNPNLSTRTGLTPLLLIMLSHKLSVHVLFYIS